MLNFDASIYCKKIALQNAQNDCHQWLSRSSKVHQIRFRPGLRPVPRWGSLQRYHRLPSWFKGDLLLRGGRAGRMEGRGKGGGGRGREGGMEERGLRPRPFGN